MGTACGSGRPGDDATVTLAALAVTANGIRRATFAVTANGTIGAAYGNSRPRDRTACAETALMVAAHARFAGGGIDAAITALAAVPFVTGNADERPIFRAAEVIGRAAPLGAAAESGSDRV